VSGWLAGIVDDQDRLGPADQGLRLLGEDASEGLVFQQAAHTKWCTWG
jgi:hypothetical protein